MIESKLWQIERRWLVLRPGREPVERTTLELADLDALPLFGAAGIGKTVEAKRLADHERSLGRDVREYRLAEHCGTSADELRGLLTSLSDSAGTDTAIYLDALDEAMVPLRRAGLVLAKWVQNELNGKGARLRITCRSAVWPSVLATSMSDYRGEDAYAPAFLQPLTDDDISMAASSRGIDPSVFLDQVRSARAEVLAQQPLTLKMLLGLYEAGTRLPSTLQQLFADGLRVLATDRHERVEIGTELKVSPHDLLAAAERLACYMVLTGRETVDLRDEPAADRLTWSDLAGLKGGGPPLDRDLLRAVGSSGLCDSACPGCFGFAHRQYAEYLAGQRLAKLLPHQTRSLLASPAGWQAGVAGPLRETAAFAAMASSESARWIAQHDPEVVGLSDVADQDLRRRAMLGLLDQFRRREMTDAQVGRGELELRGFQYDDAEADLRPVLTERGDACEDVLECAVELIESWKLSAMSDDLADLILDPTAPLHPRKAAGYALLKFGTSAARDRLKPLIAGVPGDEHNELRALAVRCNWPNRLTVPELLDALTPRLTRSFHGAYEGLLWELDHEGFDAEGYRAQGLKWARRNFSSLGGTDPSHRIAARIVHAAVRELDGPEMADALVDVMLHCAAAHMDSPLGPLQKTGYHVGHQESELPAPLPENTGSRRLLIDRLAKRVPDPKDVWWTARKTPGLCSLDDFEWLLERATDETLSLEVRQNYVEIARWLPWHRHRRCVRAWKCVRDSKPVTPTLDGWVARTPVEWVRMRWRRWRHHTSELREKWKYRSKRVRPSPARRVRAALRRAEREDPRHFFGLCGELTSEAKSRICGSERFLTRSPGWERASGSTRARIVAAAKSLLKADIDDPETCREKLLNTIQTECMAAMWLVLEQDRDWLEHRDAAWWERWCWYILRELHPNLHGEPDEPKAQLFRLLHEHAPANVRKELTRLATEGGEHDRSLLSSLLRLTDGIDDPELDQQLCKQITTGEITPDRIGTVAQFVLARRPTDAVSACLGLLDLESPDGDESPAVHAAVSLLHERIAESWEQVTEFMERRKDLGRRILASFAHGNRFQRGLDDDESKRPLDSLSPVRLGRLAGLLLELYPPESDPHYEGAYFVGSDDSARELRGRVISALGDRSDADAVIALRELERRFESRYPWLRRPRASAERALRLSQWRPIPLDTIAELLSSNRKRLLRSAEDVLDGVEAALTAYEEALHREGAPDVEDLWNTPRGAHPSPKEEEQVSKKLCDAVRAYFAEYAVAADREIEIRRRVLPKKAGGAPGSKLDVLVQVPARGTSGGDPIRVPIEVKLSCNNEAKTGLKDQLVDRYMTELGTSYGAFAVAWMSAPNLAVLKAGHRPKWPDIVIARAELEAQAEAARTDDAVVVRAIVIDASLR